MRLDTANYWLGVVVVLGGVIGTPLGGWLGDHWAKGHGGAYFWLSGVSMLAAVPFILVALMGGLCGWPPWAIFGNILIGLILAFINYGPANAIIINVTAPRIRAAAFAVNLFLIHLLGDIPSPYAMGGVSDLVRGNSTRSG